MTDSPIVLWMVRPVLAHDPVQFFHTYDAAMDFILAKTGEWEMPEAVRFMPEPEEG